MKLDTLAPLFDIPSVHFYSLQFGGLTATEKAILEHHQVIDMSPSIRSLADTANGFVKSGGICCDVRRT